MTPGPTNSATDSATVHVRHEREEIDRAEAGLLKALERHGYTETSRFAVRLAIEEALSNAFRHGHKGLPADATIRLEYSVGPREVKVRIEDQGPGFQPEAVPDPTLDENLELPSGRGLLLMRAYMSEVEYAGRGNVVEMIYRKPASEAKAG